MNITQKEGSGTSLASSDEHRQDIGWVYLNNEQGFKRVSK